MKIETIDLKALRLFVETAETLSFTQASENLQLPKSAVSKAVSKLELQLGVKILERSSRVVRLTEAGQILYTRATSLLNDAQHLLQDVQGLQTTVNGHLRLAAPPALGRYISKHLIAPFLKQWPDVSVSLKLSYEFEDLFKQGLDLAFRMGHNHDINLIEKPLGFSNRILVASKNYLAQYPALQHPNELKQHQCLQLFNQNISQWTLVKNQHNCIVSTSGAFQCSDMVALKQVLLQDIGIAQLPWFVVSEEINSRQLQQVLPDWTSPSLPISAVYRENINKPPKLAAFLTLLEGQPNLFDLAVP
ncbi:MAG: LysR family transcriptional regulator [Pseudomonadales bacterium]|nr:LysR family transcriptional regulator [Pseudomonadales bacterium]